MTVSRADPPSALLNFLRHWNAPLRLGLVLLALGLGLWGFQLRDPAVGTDAWLRHVYMTIQMLTMTFPGDLRGLPWQLQTAKFLLPAITLFETLNFISGTVFRTIRHALLARLRRPVLISVGANPLGANLLHQLRHIRDPASGRRIARSALVTGGTREAVIALERLGIPTYPGDPREGRSWRFAHADRARLLIVAHGDDIENANAGVAAARLLARLPIRRKPEVLALVEDQGIAEQIARVLDRPDRELVMRCLSVTTEAARELFLAVPLASRKPDRGIPSHILILGAEPAAVAVLRHALSLAQDTASAGPIITIVADSAALHSHWLLHDAAIPPFVATLRKHVWSGAGPLPDNLTAALADSPPVVMACVCLPDEAALACGLSLATLESEALDPDAVIAVHQSREDQLLGEIARDHGGKTRPLVPFGALLPRTVLNQLLAGDVDDLPRAIHETYLEGLRAHGATTGTRLEWAGLPENMREANRAVSYHLPVKLAAIGCQLSPGVRQRFHFTENDIETLIQIEHRRWCAERILQGWRYGPVRDNAARIHPNLVAFDELDSEAQQKDRVSIEALADIVGVAKLHIQRRPH